MIVTWLLIYFIVAHKIEPKPPVIELGYFFLQSISPTKSDVTLAYVLLTLTFQNMM